MKSAPNIDDLINRTERGELAEDESGWSADYGGNTLLLRTADANLAVVEEDRRVLITENSEAAPLGDLLMEICSISMCPMPEDPGN